jgi:hypothetical protein
MNNKRIFTVNEHYLIEIDSPYGNGTMSTTWEVFIADKKFEYRGKAIEIGGQDRSVPWMVIKEPKDGLETMINAIEVHMRK